MKSINKKLYTALAVCLLSLLLTVGVMAETSSSTAGTSSVQSTPVSSTTGDVSSDTTSGDSSDTESGDESGSDVSDSSDLTSNESDITSDSSNLSSTVVSSATSSKKTYHGNIGGYINDETDTSGWGTGDEEVSEPLVSVGTTEKGEGKQISNYSGLLWVLIWIPILLIIGSVAALIYVNRKSFLTEGAPTDGDEPSKKQKTKNSHKKRTNVYKPRD